MDILFLFFIPILKTRLDEGLLDNSVSGKPNSILYCEKKPMQTAHRRRKTLLRRPTVPIHRLPITKRRLDLTNPRQL